jgi:exopolysaccharide production protein ExoQ
MKLNMKFVAKAYIIFCLCLNANVLVELLGLAGGSERPIFLTFSSYLLLISSLALLIPIWRRTLDILFNTPWIFGLYIIQGLSFLWSSNPKQVFLSFASIGSLFACGLIISTYLSVDEAVETIRKTIIFLAVASAVIQTVSPRHAAGTIELDVPGWTGIYGEKNHFGVGMGEGLIAVLASPRRWNLWKFAQVILLSILLLGSQSTTSIGFAAVVACLYLFLKLRKRLRPIMAATAISATILAFLFVPNLSERVLAAGGKSTNLTGRDVIWSFVISKWEEKPILGYGFFSFWSEHEDEIVQEFGWNPSSSHNGFLEVALTSGVVGEVFLIGALFEGGLCIYRASRAGRYLASRWLLLSWIALLIENVTEADFLVPGPIWFLYCIVFFLTYVDIRKSKSAGRMASDTKRDLSSPAIHALVIPA